MLDTDLRRMCKTAVLVYSESLNRLCTMWHDFQYILGDLLFYLFGGLSLYVYIYIHIGTYKHGFVRKVFKVMEEII